MFIPVILGILARNKRQKSIPKQYTLGCYRFDCAFKTMGTAYNSFLIFVSIRTNIHRQSAKTIFQVIFGIFEKLNKSFFLNKNVCSLIIAHKIATT